MFLFLKGKNDFLPVEVFFFQARERKDSFQSLILSPSNYELVSRRTLKYSCIIVVLKAFKKRVG